MVRHNNAISNNHFRKDWKRNVRSNFSQPMRMRRRANLRSVNLRKAAPTPMKLFRPIIRCPTVRYHTKRRVGRGFSIQELKQLKLNKQTSKNIGIAVDYRRRSKSLEVRVENVQRLSEYLSRLIVFPVKRTLKKEASEKLKITNITIKNVKVLPKSKTSGIKARKITEEEKVFQAFQTLKRARAALKKVKKVRKDFDVEVGI